MKSIKEKAEAYDKVLEWATEAHKVCDGMLKEDLEHLFPELKESEDEMIRKELLKAVKESEYSLHIVMTPRKRESLIAWLEKQGEQKLTWSEEDEDNLSSAIYYIRREPYRECDVEPIVDWLRNKLSSLKPQSTWKPSDEQMESLKLAIYGEAFRLDELQKLYDQLKAL